MDGHLTKTRGSKKGQIRPMIRFRVFSAARVATGRVNFSLQSIFPRIPVMALWQINRQAKYFWNTSRLERWPTVEGPKVIPRPKDPETFDAPRWKARRCIAAILDTDLRFRIAKCRLEGCEQGPYFELRNRHGHVYKHGLFCCVAHNNKANGAQNAKGYRKLCQQRSIKDAATVLAKQNRITTPENWSDEIRMKMRNAANKSRPRDAAIVLSG